MTNHTDYIEKGVMNLLVYYIIAIYLITVVVSLATFACIVTYFVYNAMVGIIKRGNSIRFERYSDLFNKMMIRKMIYCFIPVANMIISLVRIVNCDRDIEETQKSLLNERKK